MKERNESRFVKIESQEWGRECNRLISKQIWILMAKHAFQLNMIILAYSHYINLDGERKGEEELRFDNETTGIFFSPSLLCNFLDPESDPVTEFVKRNGNNQREGKEDSPVFRSPSSFPFSISLSTLSLRTHFHLIHSLPHCRQLRHDSRGHQ